MQTQLHSSAHARMRCMRVLYMYVWVMAQCILLGSSRLSALHWVHCSLVWVRIEFILEMNFSKCDLFILIVYLKSHSYLLLWYSHARSPHMHTTCDTYQNPHTTHHAAYVTYIHLHTTIYTHLRQYTSIYNNLYRYSTNWVYIHIFA